MPIFLPSILVKLGGTVRDKSQQAQYQSSMFNKDNVDDELLLHTQEVVSYQEARNGRVVCKAIKAIIYDLVEFLI